MIGLGVCDSFCRFIFFDVSNPGGTPDLNCFRNSLLYGWIENGLFPRFASFGGDKAFLSEQCHHVMTPFSKSELDRAKRLVDEGVTYQKMIVFNFCLSSYRVAIERAYGMLVGRWLILNSTLEHKLSTSTRIIMACVYLHNFCISYYEKRNPHHMRSATSFENWLQRQEADIYEHSPNGLAPPIHTDLDNEEDGFPLHAIDRKTKFMDRLYNIGIRSIDEL